MLNRYTALEGGLVWLEKSDQSTMSDTMKQVIVGLNRLERRIGMDGEEVNSTPYQTVFPIMDPVKQMQKTITGESAVSKKLLLVFRKDGGWKAVLPNFLYCP